MTTLLSLLQILYNRTMVQLGICAFRQGMIRDAHNALLDIQSSGRAKELLGQGLLMRTMQERNQEQEKIEKRRQIPFHMHINLELLECVYLVSAMLLEIPYMAAHEFDARRRMISKQFHHQLRVGERQPLLGEYQGSLNITTWGVLLKKLGMFPVFPLGSTPPPPQKKISFLAFIVSTDGSGGVLG